MKKTKAIHKLERHSFKKNDFKNIGLESEENRPPIDMIWHEFKLLTGSMCLLPITIKLKFNIFK